MLSWSINHSILAIHLERGGLFVNLSLDRSIAFIDLEITGLNPLYDRIIELSALKVHPDGS